MTAVTSSPSAAQCFIVRSYVNCTLTPHACVCSASPSSDVPECFTSYFKFPYCRILVPVVFGIVRSSVEFKGF